MSEPDYTGLTDEIFYGLLYEVVVDRGTEILSVPGVYEILSEHYNEQVLQDFEDQYPELAFPPEEDDEDD